MGQLNGKTALVTGAASGLGLAIASRFSTEGADIVSTDLMADPPSHAVGRYLPMDVTNEKQVSQTFQECADIYERLDILVANAGVSGGGICRSEDIDFAQWDRTFAVNTRGVMCSIKYAIPLMKEEGGSIVIVSSAGAVRPLPLQTAYGASKAASAAIAKSVSRELGDYGIRVNALCPGAVNTALFRKNAAARAKLLGITVAEDEARLANLASLRRLTTQDEVAATALYLASDQSSAMTGELVKIDCGRV